MSIKAWFILKAIKGELPLWMYRPIGQQIKKKLEEESMDVINPTVDSKPWYRSRTVWISIVGVILGAVQPVSTAFGHPITVPTYIYEVLAGMGLYTLRTGDTPIK